MDHTQSDHDLLVTIHTKVERALVDIKELKDNLSQRVAIVEEQKFNKKEAEVIHLGFDKRITWLERIAYGGLAIIAAIEFYFRITK